MDITKEWYRMIEDVIQCPVCLEVNSVFYIHCKRGHHTCGFCIKNLTKCPICNDNFLPELIRHLVVEDLMSRLCQIKLSIDEDIKSQQDQSVQTDILITNSSIETQTDETNLSIINSPIETQTDETNLSITNSSVSMQTGERHCYKPAYNKRLKKQIINEAYSYPCLICWCNFNKFLELKEHLEQNHQDIQQEHALNKYPKKTFVVQCNMLPWECDYLILKNNILYFINIIVRSNGCFKCSVRFIKGMDCFPASYPRITVLEALYYSIRILDCKNIDTENLISYVGKIKPHTAKCKMEDVYDVCFQTTVMSNMIKKTKSFKFEFSIL